VSARAILVSERVARRADGVRMLDCEEGSEAIHGKVKGPRCSYSLQRDEESARLTVDQGRPCGRAVLTSAPPRARHPLPPCPAVGPHAEPA
jgi:hypothetical protein